MKVRVTLNCQLKSAQTETLSSFLKLNLPRVRSFEGCLNVSVYFTEDNVQMLLEEQWLSIEHHQSYIEHIKKNGVLAELAEFFESTPTIKYFYQKDI